MNFRNFFKTFNIRRFDFLLLFLVLALNTIGVFAIGSAQASLQTRQIQGLIVSLVLMVFVAGIDYRRIVNYYWVYYAFNLFLLSLIFTPLGTKVGGATRWVNLGGFTFQPSESAKILLILFYAKFIMKYKNKMKSFPCVAACVALVLPPLILIMRQPDLSTSIMVLTIFAVMMFIGGLSYKVVGTVLAVAIPSIILFIRLVDQEGSTFLHGYQQARILAWLHPEDYAMDEAYQTMNSIMAIGSGQLTGKGYNSNEITSVLNGGYISESQTDFIFTVIGEEFGFIGGCTVVILLALIALRILMIAGQSNDMAGAVICGGVAAWIGFQGFINICVATGIIPNTGLPLPFVSYGLTSMASLYLGIGLVLNVRMQNENRRTITATSLVGLTEGGVTRL